MISWLNRRQAPKTILLIFGGTRTHENNQEQKCYHFRKYYFSKSGNHTFLIYSKACVQCFYLFFTKRRVFHFYHFLWRRAPGNDEDPRKHLEKCISISYLSKIKRGFGKFCVFKQGIPQRPQHSDSHLCTWPMWSRSECVGRFVFSNFSVCFLWVSIMPKWLIHDSGRIAICFGHVWNFQMCTNIDPRTP